MIQRESRLLLNTPPMVIQPELACAIGVNEAIVLQQIQYWLTKSCTENNIRDGRRWVYNPMETQREERSSWKGNFPFFGLSTIKRIFTKLENKGIIIAGEYNTDKRDRTQWYTIDYEKLDQITGSDRAEASVHIDLMHSVNVNRALPETTITETTTEITIGETETETKKEKISWILGKGWEGDIEALFEVFTEVTQDLREFEDLRDYEPRMLFEFMLGEQHRWWVGKNTSDPQKIFAKLVSWFRDRYRSEDNYLLRCDLIFCRLVGSYGISGGWPEDPDKRAELVTSLKRLDSLLTPEGRRIEAYGEWARQNWQSNGSASRRIGDVLNLRKAEIFLSAVA